MAIKAILDKLDDAPEALREHYAEKDGKFVLGVESVGGYALEDVTGLKSALGAERTSREALERQVVKFKDLDPEKARDALTKLAEFEKLDPTAEADKIANTKFEAAKTQLLEKHGSELGSRDERIGHLTKTVDVLVREQRATAAIADAKGSVDLLLPHVLSATRTVEKDGKFITEVVDAAGNVRIGDAQGNPMTIAALVAEMRESDRFARAFDGDGQSGSGAEHNNSGGGASGPANWGGDPSERRAAIAKKFGLKE